MELLLEIRKMEIRVNPRNRNRREAKTTWVRVACGGYLKEVAEKEMRKPFLKMARPTRDTFGPMLRVTGRVSLSSNHAIRQ